MAAITYGKWPNRCNNISCLPANIRETYATCLQWQRAAQTCPSQHKPTDWTGPAQVTVTADDSDLGSDLDSAPSVGFHSYNFGWRRFDRRSAQTDEGPCTFDNHFACEQACSRIADGAVIASSLSVSRWLIAGVTFDHTWYDRPLTKSSKSHRIFGRRGEKTCCFWLLKTFMWYSRSVLKSGFFFLVGFLCGLLHFSWRERVYNFCPRGWQKLSGRSLISGPDHIYMQIFIPSVKTSWLQVVSITKTHVRTRWKQPCGPQKSSDVGTKRTARLLCHI